MQKIPLDRLLTFNPLFTPLIWGPNLVIGNSDWTKLTTIAVVANIYRADKKWPFYQVGIGSCSGNNFHPSKYWWIPRRFRKLVSSRSFEDFKFYQWKRCAKNVDPAVWSKMHLDTSSQSTSSFSKDDLS